MEILKHFKEKSNLMAYFRHIGNKTIFFIREFLKKKHSFLEEFFLILLIFFSIFLGIGIGRLSVITERKTPITIKDTTKPESNGFSGDGEEGVLTAVDNKKEIFVASRNGTKYYLSDCIGARRILSANLISFSTREEAESAGYQKAVNCPGL